MIRGKALGWRERTCTGQKARGTRSTNFLPMYGKTDHTFPLCTNSTKSQTVGGSHTAAPKEFVLRRRQPVLMEQWHWPRRLGVKVIGDGLWRFRETLFPTCRMRLCPSVRRSVRHQLPFCVESGAEDSPKRGGIPENSTKHGTSGFWSRHGVQVVAGSNPVAPTMSNESPACSNARNPRCFVLTSRMLSAPLIVRSHRSRLRP